VSEVNPRVEEMQQFAPRTEVAGAPGTPAGTHFLYRNILGIRIAHHPAPGALSRAPSLFGIYVTVVMKLCAQLLGPRLC